MTAYEQEMQRLAERIGELEAHRAALEKLVSEVGRIVDQSVDGRAVGRIEALETHLTRCQDVLVKLDTEKLERDKQLDGLYLAKAKYDVETWLPGIAERLRQDRWHATYNAVRGGMEASTDSEIDVEHCHEYCVTAADRAHGLLDGKAPSVVPDGLVGKTLVEAHGYLSRLFKSYAPQCEPLPDLLGVCTQVDNLLTRLRDVDALVKAALGVVNEWGESDGLDPRWPDNKVKIALAIHALAAAAKPFEREQR